MIATRSRRPGRSLVPSAGGALRALARLALAIAAIEGSARAQAGPPLATDDPKTPGDGKFEVNVAATLERSGRTNTIEAPVIDLNYGLGERVQLKLEVPWVFVEDDVDLDGLGNSLFGIKWRFLDEDRYGFAMSTYPQVEFETPGSSAADRDLVEPGTGLFLPIEAATSIGPFEVVTEVGYLARDLGEDQWVTGIAGSHVFASGVELLAEVRCEGSRSFSSTNGFFDVGTRVPLGGDDALLASVGSGLWSSGDAEDSGLRAYLGFQILR